MPTPSKLTRTPAPPVSARTWGAIAAGPVRPCHGVWVTITASAPAACARAAFSGVLTVPITRAPRWRSHCTSSSPTPPAAAWTSTLSPGSTRAQRSTRNSAVQPLSRAVAASSSLTVAGVWSSWAAGRLRAVA